MKLQDIPALSPRGSETLKPVAPKRRGAPATGRDPLITVRLPASLVVPIKAWAQMHHGSFQRSFQVPDGVDVDKIEASFKNGVLTVIL